VAPQRISDTVYRVADGIVNWYLVDEGGEVALYDAGWPRSWPRVESSLREIGRSVADVSAIVLTHAHPDHLGAAEEARKKCGATVYVHAPEEARAHGQAPGSSPFTLVPGLLPSLWRPTATAFVVEATVRGFMFPTWVEEVTTFGAGEPLDVPGRPRPVPTPGHTEGHVALYLADQGIVFSGDSLATLNVLTRERGPQLMPHPLQGDADQARGSLEALGALSAQTLLPGHGEPFSGQPAAAVARAREQASGSDRVHVAGAGA
jgi:glyoxylase-like metal-dependent hydrolase (beta-lactamase superfamily II)